LSKIVGTLLLLGLLFAAILSVVLILVQWVRSSDSSNTKKTAVVYTISAPASGLVENSAVVKETATAVQTSSVIGLVTRVLNLQSSSVQAVVTAPQLLFGS
jgi:hypothetical protein